MNYYAIHDQFGRPTRFDYRFSTGPSGSFLLPEVVGWTYGDLLEIHLASGRTHALPAGNFARFIEQWEKITSEH